MPQHYQAPEHITGVFAPSGELRADENGVIELSDDAADADRDALLRAGCVRIVAAPVKPVTAAPKVGAGDDLDPA